MPRRSGLSKRTLVVSLLLSLLSVGSCRREYRLKGMGARRRTQDRTYNVELFEKRFNDPNPHHEEQNPRAIIDKKSPTFEKKKDHKFGKGGGGAGYEGKKCQTYKSLDTSKSSKSKFLPGYPTASPAPTTEWTSSSKSKMSWDTYKSHADNNGEGFDPWATADPSWDPYGQLSKSTSKSTSKSWEGYEDCHETSPKQASPTQASPKLSHTPPYSTPTPTFVPTHTPHPTSTTPPSMSPTVTPQPTRTRTPSASPSTVPSRSPTPAPTPSPTPNPTPVPTPPPTVEDTAGTQSIVEVDCDAIAAGTAPTTGNVAPFGVRLDLVTDPAVEYAAVASRLQQVFQTRVAPRIAGCDVPPRQLRQERFLQQETVITNPLFGAVEPDPVETCATDADGNACTVTSTGLDIYYEGDDTSDFRARILAAINAEQPFNVDGLVGAFNLGVEENPQGGVVGIVQEVSNDEDRGIGAGGIVGVVAGSLALLLLLLLLVRRRRNNDEVKHLELVDEDGDTMVRDLEGSPSTDESDGSPFRARVANIVGEDESIETGWTPRTGDISAVSIMDDLRDHELSGAQLDRLYKSRDVHKCSSATCEVCEKRRREGMQFIPTGSPPKPQTLPAGAQREYLAEDTVAL